MVMHARSGGRLEIMGLLLGKIDGSTMVVMDSFALPVEGTETRVNAQAAAYEYMTEYIEAAKRVRVEGIEREKKKRRGGRVEMIQHQRYCRDSWLRAEVPMGACASFRAW